MAVKKTEKVIIPLTLYETMWSLLHLIKDSSEFNTVLNKIDIGKPYLNKAKVKASVKGEKKGDKVVVYKWKRRKKYRKKQGHRQIYTLLTITGISA